MKKAGSFLVLPLTFTPRSDIILHMNEVGIQFMEEPGDVFSDYHEFENAKKAAEWFTPIYEGYKRNRYKIEVIKPQWPVEDRLFGNTFIKGYRIEMGDKNLWVRIFRA